MPKVVKGRRKRAYRPKTRTGCLTCRKRRVKCDEARPACLRCTSTSRICDGYYYVQPHTGTVVAGPSFDIHVHASPESRRSFAFFMQRTCPQQAGFFGSVFWERLVFQVAYHESAVRHAVIAIGSMHELLERGAVITDVDKIFALDQYNLAIRELLLPLSRGGERSVDNIQGHHLLAGSHIRSGVKLLRETLYDHGVLRHQVLGSKYDGDCYVPLEVIARIFAELDPEVNMIIGAYKFSLYERFFSNATSGNTSLSFNSIEEAKNIFEYGRGLFLSSQAPQSPSDAVDSPAAVEGRTNLFATLMSKYSLALQDFVKSKSAYFTPKEDIALAVLQLHVLGSYISLYIEQSPPDKKASWDKFMPQIKEMIVLGEKVISSTASGNSRGQSTFFCLDMGIIIPLYTLASQCGDPMIRRKAIVLLRSTSRQEGLWNSSLVAQAAERIMEIEESGLGDVRGCIDGPNRARPLSIRPFLELDGRGGRLQYIRRGEGADAQIKVVEKVFGW